ncbi:hypothetical protein RQP46_002514 [Phenoliferia psychrophenolica]
MVSFTLATLVATLVSAAAAQTSTMDVAWSDRMTVCMSGGPMNVTSGNWAEAQKLFGDSSKPAWIASYNGDTYDGSCLTFSGNSVNVPASCDSPALPVLCHSEATSSSSSMVMQPSSSMAASSASAAAASSTSA